MKRELLLLLGLLTISWAGDVIEYKPLNIGAFEEFGSVQNGLYSLSIIGDLTQTGNDHTSIGDREWVDHFGAYFRQEAVVNGRLHLSGGFGGIFQFRKPEIISTNFSSSQGKAFFIGPAQTDAVYCFGDPEKPWLRLGAGMFPYKYNPDAWNLGEYLFRSEPYPTTMSTGGYAVVNSASANLEGFKANFQRGNFKADALLITETTLAPFYDWSLALLADYSVAGGLLDLGAGVKFDRLIPVKPSRTTAHVKENSYFVVSFKDSTGKVVNVRDYVGNSDYYKNAKNFYQTRDSIKAQQYDQDQQIEETLFDVPDSVSGTTFLPVPGNTAGMTMGRSPKEYFTSAGTLLMARASLDPKKFFAAPMLGPQDLKVYFEVDVLGVKNYPVFYEKITQRMPVMMGFNFPCFHLLDVLAIQGEFFNSPWPNNNFPVGNGNASHQAVVNTPYIPLGSDDPLSKNDYNDQSKNDNWKWSVVASKSIRNRLTVSLQVARDHLRLPSSQDFYGPNFEPNEITTFKNSWYWVTQISWGI